MLSLEEVKNLEVHEKFIHKIFTSFSELDSSTINKIANTFGNDKITEMKFRFIAKHKIVLTFINDELVSYCFFSDRPFKFSLFTLKEKELYFYDCFTFEEFRGKSSIYSEVKYVIDKYKEFGYKTAHVEIEENNFASQKAFKKLGFEKSRTYYVVEFLNARIIFSKKVF